MVADNGVNGKELWKTDGTDLGTVMVKDINPGADSSVTLDSAFNYFYTTSNLYFAATDGTTGYELWKSDGSAPNTLRVIDINPGNPGSYPKFVTYFNGTVLFTAHDGDNGSGLRDLFRLDGAFSPLAVGLSDFSGTLFDRLMKLNWSTVTESNTKNFEIERSKDGTQFESIGSVMAAGNSTIKKEYAYNDADAFNTGVNKLYYRLKMINKDGTFNYSKVIVVSVDRDTKLLYTYPNPVNGQLKVIVNSGTRKQLALQITGDNGKQVYNQGLNNAQGSSSYNINVLSFAKGLYYIRLVTDEGMQTVKFVKN